LIEASPHDAGTAYLAANRYQLSDRRPYVYRTHDYGSTWTKITEGIGDDDFARVIREDPVRAGLLYVGTEHGIYVSFDDGDHWESLLLGLPALSVQGLVAEAKDLVIGTHGRGLYVLDDITPLRQQEAGLADRALHVFRPYDATRTVDPGVTIDYYLGRPADRVTVEILDGAGEVVQRFEGTTADRGDLPAPAIAPRRPPPPRVRTDVGTHRIRWNLRYADAIGFEGMILYWPANPALQGPLAPPGEYRVRVSANGESMTQSVRVLRDERLIDVTDDDLQAQFQLSRQVVERLNEANRTVVRIRELKSAIADRVDGPRGNDLAAAGQRLTEALTSVEGEIYQYRNRSNQDPLNFPIKLNNQLAGVLGVIQSADAAPTAQSYAVFEELSGELDEHLARLDALLTGDLADFNRRLREANLAPIS
jgi:hypothetical protein